MIRGATATQTEVHVREIDWKGLTWLNPPSRIENVDGALVVWTLDQTDFWQSTLYGFVHDSGHFLGMEVEGDIGLEVSFVGGFSSLYDQAGLMIRVDSHDWIKAGVEYTDGALQASVVVTHETSDWSVAPLPGLEPTSRITVRASRVGDSVTIRLWADDHEPRLLRVAHLAPEAKVQMGPMCCSPQRSGLRVRFESLRIGPPDSELHQA